MPARYLRALIALALFLFLSVMFFLLNQTSQGQAQKPTPFPTEFECRWADGAITIDGDADEPAWKNAPIIDSFHLPWLGKDDRLGKTATKARVLWDENYFYFHADMEDTTLFADVKDHDGDTWRNDVFEVFFQPDRKKPGYYEFEVSAANTQLDAFFPKWDLDTIEKQIKVGEFHMETKVKLRGKLEKHDGKDQGWSVEGRIPWSDFLRTGGRPNPGETWGFSLCRMDFTKDGKDVELSTISPITQKKLPAFFHQHEDWATLKFVGAGKVTQAPHAFEKRTPLTTSKVIGSPEPPPPFRVKRALEHFRPEYVIQAKVIPGTREMLAITQPTAYGPTTYIRFKYDPATKTRDAVKLFDTPVKGTATDLEFHPQFANNGYVYIGWNGDFAGKVKHKACRITRYTMDRKTLMIDEKSAKNILEWESDGHNGVAICFGHDGFMYVTSGDGTSDSDTDEKGQSTDTMLSKVLRIDVDNPANGKEYSVPKDNPFVDDKRFVPETWAYGLRNPWRITCDSKTGHIWVGNNGQDLWEQAYFLRKGDNYGWSVTEGSHPFYEKRKPGPTPIVKPTIEHHHSEFRSLTGGVVYHGKKLPDLQGAYIYGDHSTGRIWGMKHDGTKPVWHKELAFSTMHITGFGIDPDGELLIYDHAAEGSGGFFTLEPTPKEPGPNTFPKKLSETGLFENVQKHTMKPGVIPYSVNAPFWSDGLHKERWIAVPGDGTVPYSRKNGWNFPDQTVIVKSFALETIEGVPESRKWIETRFLTKQDGEWFGYTYLWNDAGTEATLVERKGLDKEFTVKTKSGNERKQVWHFPSRAECMVCHSRAANFVLGLCSLQMNKTHAYPTANENQLVALQHLGMLKLDFAGEAQHLLAERATAKGLKDKAAEEFIKLHMPQAGQRELNPTAVADLMPKLVNPFDKKHDLNTRARSFLHSNCASCHVEAGGGNAQMNLDFTTALAKMKLLNEKPIHFTFDLKEPKLVSPGKPDESVLLKRLSLRGQHQMPPIGSNLIDEEGVQLMRDWVQWLK